MRENFDRKRVEEEIGNFYVEYPYPNFEAKPKKIRSFLYPYLDEINKKQQEVAFLDAGCGTGHALVRVSMDYPEFGCYGIDLSKKSIEISKKLAQRYKVNVSFHCGSYAEQLPFDTKFDFIYCSGTIHHNIESAIAVTSTSFIFE